MEQAQCGCGQTGSCQRGDDPADPEDLLFREDTHGAENQSQFDGEVRPVQSIGLMVDVFTFFSGVVGLLDFLVGKLKLAFSCDDKGSQSVIFGPIFHFLREAVFIRLDVLFRRFVFGDVTFPLFAFAFPQSFGPGRDGEQFGVSQSPILFLHTAFLGLEAGECVAGLDFEGRRLREQPVGISLQLQDPVVLAMPNQGHGGKASCDQGHRHAHAVHKGIGAVSAMGGVFCFFELFV